MVEDVNDAKSASIQEKQLDRTAINSPKTDSTGMIVLDVDDFFHGGIADDRSEISKNLVDIFGMGKTEQEIFNVFVDVSLSKISVCLSSIKVSKEDMKRIKKNRDRSSGCGKNVYLIKSTYPG